ncbi:hypothetical protein EJ03DRAFT_327930 [Teratosphaeria nubilosa]|uniref:GH16 domain-containing protein n=1 Tax=Teratosphaeria nubilosa TaxID=161662 RepID=A0A6G1L982_9PEZI|nr:hypothetical protein EJ03DRAFT_327930 [Teratosphaeria nubilosa]
MLRKALVASTLLNTLAHAAPTSSNTYKLVADYSGPSFFDGWDFFTGADPTTGYVTYQSQASALQKNLAGFISRPLGPNGTTTSAYIGVDYTTNLTGSTASGRDSVRISTNATFSGGGLFIADINHMPIGTACGTWPALWLLGTDGTWPQSGEIDIMEGVNLDTMNQVTLHTAEGCSVSNASTAMLGALSETYCGPTSANSGCGVVAPSTADLTFAGNESVIHATAGKAFNAANGAVYATLWDEDGISVYMFPHSRLPSDIRSGAPDPSSWTVKPLAKFGGDSCDFMESFYDLQLVIDTTFCGSWAGKQWNVSNVVGQEACAVSTGYETCEAFVAAEAGAFEGTYWDVASIRAYQLTANNTYGVSASGVGKRGVGSVGEQPTVQNISAAGRGSRHGHGHGHALRQLSARHRSA